MRANELANLGMIIEHTDESIKFNLRGILIVTDMHQIMKTWLQQLSKKPKVIEIDCCELTFVDSYGIGTMVWFFNTAAECGTKIFFLNLLPNITNTFEAAKLNSFSR
ncbi:MAG: STAS domain-containing protein [bacterium]|nr:STAS domain-containing protein [bacterium]